MSPHSGSGSRLPAAALISTEADLSSRSGDVSLESRGRVQLPLGDDARPPLKLTVFVLTNIESC